MNRRVLLTHLQGKVEENMNKSLETVRTVVHTHTGILLKINKHEEACFVQGTRSIFDANFYIW